MRRLIVVLSLLGLLLAGCSDDDEPTVSSGDGTTTSSAKSAAEDGKDSVAITMSDYAYSVDGKLKPGGTMKLTNAGKEFHMLGVGQFEAGKTFDDLKTALAKPAEGQGEGDAGGGEGESEGDEEDQNDPTKGILKEVELPVGGFFGPGQSAEITVPDFGAGEYALICFLPTEGDAKATPHYKNGMVNTLTVAGEKAPEPTADASYAVQTGKAIEGPKTLTAGRHVLKITASGEGTDELEPTIAKPDAGKTIVDMDKAFDALFEGTMPVGAADKIPGDLVVSVFDLGSAKVMYLTVNLTPGTYLLGAQDSDDENAPPDPVEKILVKVT